MAPATLVHLIRRTAWAVPALVFVACCVGTLPVLRHDWVLPPHGIAATAGVVSGWSPLGLGVPVSYPASFLAVLVLAGIDAVLGAFGTHVVMCVGISLLISLGARAATGGRKPAPADVQFAAAAVAICNPWVYTQLTAGHTFMLAAYGASLWVAAEALRPQPRPLALSLLIAAIAPQIQFLLLTAPLYVWLAIRLRRWVVLLAWTAFALPVAVGVAGAHAQIAGTPLTIDWERSQSVPLGAAFLLRGYFTGYDTALPWFETVGLVLLALLAATGTVLARRRSTVVIAATGVLALLFATGLDGPFAGVLGWAFVHVAASGVFRELYDLVGIGAIAYVLLAARAANRFIALRLAAVVAGVLLCAAWPFAPPLRMAVDARSLPAAPIDTAPGARFALVPAFQPLGFDGMGSGIDPDARERSDGSVPINVTTPGYPIDAALGAYLADGDVTMLRALGVAQIVTRARFATQLSALRGQWALPPDPRAFAPRSDAQRALDPPPLLGLIDGLPVPANVPVPLERNVITPNDARQARGFAVPAAWREQLPVDAVHAPRTEHDAAKGWVDARFAFAERADLAQSWGGALTSDASAPLALPAAGALLVHVEGALLDAHGRTLTRSPGWRWIGLPAHVDVAFCRGLCLVAAAAALRPEQRTVPAAQTTSAVALHCMITWWCTAYLPPGRARTLRFLTAFDPGWTARTERPLAHVRLAGVFNGWLIPPMAAGSRITLLQTNAALIACAECAAIVLYLGVLWRLALTRSSARPPGD